MSMQMQQPMRKKSRGKFFTRAMAFVLCLIFAATPFFGLDYTALEAFAAELADADKMTISISWEPGTPSMMEVYDKGAVTYTPVAAGTSDARRIQVKAKGGNSDVTTKVYLSTFDISACEAAGEYVGFKRKEITIKSGQTVTVEIDNGTQSLQKKYDVENRQYTDEDDTISLVKTYDYNFTNNYESEYDRQNKFTVARQYGIKIVDFDQEVAKLGNHVLRAQIRGASTFTVEQNLYALLVNTQGAAASGFNEYMFSYDGAQSYYQNTSYTYYQPTKNEKNAYTGSYNGSSGTPSVHVYDERWCDLFFDPYEAIEKDYEASALRDYFGADTFDIYYTGRFTMGQSKNANQRGFEIQIQDNGKVLFKDGLVTPKKNFIGLVVDFFQDISVDGQHYNYSDSNTVDKSVAISRGNWTRWAKADDSGSLIKLYVKNNATTYDKQVNYAKLYSCLVNEETPYIVDYTIDQSINYGYTQSYDGTTKQDEMYIAVRFSKPVQVVDPDNKFGLKAKITGRDSSDTELVFDYVDGSFTDTLIFKATLPVNCYGTDVQLLSFTKTNSSGEVNVADLMMGRFCNNNGADLSSSQLGTISGVKVDARTPIIEEKNVPVATSVLKKQVVTLKISNIGLDGTVQYAWSTSDNIDTITSWTTYAYRANANNDFTGSGYNDIMYLHVRATGTTGMVTQYTSPGVLFDNTAPVFETVSGTDYNKYQQNHTLKIKITDKYNAVEKVKLYVKREGVVVIGGDMWCTKRGCDYVYQADVGYPEGEIAAGTAWENVPDSFICPYCGAVKSTFTDGWVVYDKKNALNNKMTVSENVFSMNLSHTDVGLPENSYGGYTIGFVAYDSLGNMNSSVNWGVSTVYFDNRPTYKVEVYETNTDTAKQPDLVLGDTNIYYNDTTGTDGGVIHNSMTVGTLDKAASVDDFYALYTIAIDGKVVYTDGAWVGEGKTFADYGFAAEPTVVTQTMNTEAGATYGRMRSNLVFGDTASGMYEIVYIQNGTKQSEVVQLYMTTRDATPTNYLALYDEERLLINRVWRFATNKYYNRDNPNIISQYDATPIFSSKEKAIEYALFREYQDIAILHLTSESSSIIDSLNFNTGTEYKKAPGETNEAGEGQTWLRYKSIDWKPELGSSTQTSHWVYYYYGDSIVDTIDLDAIAGKPIDIALRNNAEDIANASEKRDSAGNLLADPNTQGYYYLTDDNSKTDGNGEPYYLKSAIFYDPIALTEGECIFEGGIQWTGDKDIYDNYIDYKVTATDVVENVPLVANYTFKVPTTYTAVYYRRFGDTAWIAIPHGSYMRNVFATTGLYEIAELDGGYRSYYIYCDFTAPNLAYTFKKSGDTEKTSVFDVNFSGSVFEGMTMRFDNFVDLAHPNGNYLGEYDEYAYLYLSQSMTGIRLMKHELNAEDSKGYTLGDGSYVLTIADRLGNKTTVQIRCSEKELTVQSSISKNKDITFFINRKRNEIESFTVLRDNKVIDTEYKEIASYVQSGKYEIRVSDIYGNDYTSPVISFERELPKVDFLYKNTAGSWTAMKINAAANPSQSLPAVVSQTDNLYTISTSTAIRIAFTSSSDYAYEMVESDGVEPVERLTLSQTILEIPATEQRWKMKLYYEEDPKTFIMITCVKDVEPPEIWGDLLIPTYNNNEQTGAQNVLVSKGESTVSPAEKGGKSNAESITITWRDDTLITSVTYVHDGGEPVSYEPYPDADDDEQGFITFDKGGHYVVTVRDVLGNVNTFEYTLVHTLDFGMTCGDSEVKYHDNAVAHIVGSGANAVYDTTIYTGKDFRIDMRESMNMTFMWTNGVDTVIYELDFEKLVVVDENGETKKLADIRLMLFDVDDENIMSVIIDLLEIPGGALITAPGAFTINYTYENEVLTLSVDAPENAYEFWQFRFFDTKFTHPFVIQLERSDVKPTVNMYKLNDDLLTTNAGEEYIGSNMGVKFDGVYDTTYDKAVAYYSVGYTLDFSGIAPENITELIRSDGTLSQLVTAGYYKIVITNKYGNETIIYLRISFGMSVDVSVQYFEDIISKRTYTITAGKSQHVFTNHRVDVVIWDMKSELFVTKNGVDYTPVRSPSMENIKLTFQSVGEYVLQVTDECDNVYKLYIYITDPNPIRYNGYMTGFNEDAIKRAENYTNAPLSISVERVEADGIRYIAYRMRNSAGWVTIYDMLSEAHVEYTPEGFLNCIGQKDGEYEVLFSDSYGNLCIETVHISKREQLIASRLTQLTQKDYYSMSEVHQNGLWSNYLILLENEADEYFFSVDGVPTAFDEKGRYQCSLSRQGDGSEDHQVIYIDEYGNKYIFTMHLFRKVPVIQTHGTALEVDGASYTRGNISYSWDGEKIAAYASVNGADEVPYAKGEVISQDGFYTIRFVDIAGNVASMRITRDTRVSYEIRTSAGISHSGVTATGSIRVRDLNDSITIVETMRNGKPYTGAESNGFSFKEHGSYTMKLRDAVGNEETISFTLFNDPVQTFIYRPENNYLITQVWFDLNGNSIPYTDNITYDENGRQCFHFITDGNYRVELVWGDTAETALFNIEIDNKAPTITLVGVENGGSTRADISFSNVSRKDTLEIWLDGVKIEGDADTVLDEGGNYKVVVRDLAGNETIYEFVREYTTNTAANVLICLVLIGTALGIALYIRSRGKIRNK